MTAYSTTGIGLSLYQISRYISKFEWNPLDQESFNIVKMVINEAAFWSVLTLLAPVEFQILVASPRTN